VALEYRAAGICTNFSVGPAGDSQISTPVSIGNGSWDVKRVLGEATIHEDGSSWFAVPARTPVYFQALDERGYALQTMRSWSTLQPGERASCAGCHEAKCAAPGAGRRRRPSWQDRRPSARPRLGSSFSFIRDVQPILDRSCTSATASAGRSPGGAPGPGKPSGGESPDRPRRSASSPRRPPRRSRAGRGANAYLALLAPRPRALYGYPPAIEGDPEGRLVRWVAAQSPPPMLVPCSTGAVRSPLMKLLEDGHRGARLSPEEMRTIACWIDLAVPYCGDYEEANVWSEEGKAKYRHFLEKRRRMEEIERRNIEELIASGPARRTPRRRRIERFGGRYLPQSLAGKARGTKEAGRRDRRRTADRAGGEEPSGRLRAFGGFRGSGGPARLGIVRRCDLRGRSGLADEDPTFASPGAGRPGPPSMILSTRRRAPRLRLRQREGMVKTSAPSGPPLKAMTPPVAPSRLRSQAGRPSYCWRCSAVRPCFTCYRSAAGAGRGTAGSSPGPRRRPLQVLPEVAEPRLAFVEEALVELLLGVREGELPARELIR